MEVINLVEKFSQFRDLWSPKIVGELNDSYVKLAKLKGEFVWHRHDDEDEMFLVVKGSLTIKFLDGYVEINEGEFFIVPKGTEHMPVAEKEVWVILVEPKTTINTGNVENELTTPDEWI